MLFGAKVCTDGIVVTGYHPYTDCKQFQARLSSKSQCFSPFNNFKLTKKAISKKTQLPILALVKMYLSCSLSFCSGFCSGFCPIWYQWGEGLWYTFGSSLVILFFFLFGQWSTVSTILFRFEILLQQQCSLSNFIGYRVQFEIHV